MTVGAPIRRNRAKRERRIFAVTFAICVAIAGAVYGWIYGPAYIAYWNYTPQEGDILFQSLPRSRLVNAIEGVSDSPYSHCGIVAQRAGEWVVYEAYRGVEATPLKEFVFRGRSQGFAVYRLKSEHQQFVPATIENTKTYLGRPYDVRYRIDDEKIYCSELIYKAYRDSSGGDQLGKLVRFGDMNWRPYQDTITHFERGPVPLEREMITPKGLALASQLELVLAHKIAVE